MPLFLSDTILFNGGKMNLQNHKAVLEILASHKTNFLTAADIINIALGSREAKHVEHELKNRGHVHGVKANVSDKEIEDFIKNSYRHDVVLSLTVLKPRGYIMETHLGKDDTFQSRILKLGPKIKKGEHAYQITELGLQQLARL